MKRIISSLLLITFAFALLCGCKPRSNANESSIGTKSEISMSSNVTTESAPAVSEDDKENSSKKEENKPSSSSKKEENKKPDSSKITVNRPTAGNSSQSEHTKVSVNDRKTVVFCGMSADTANSYGNTLEDALREMNDIAKAGYINAISTRELCKQDKFWDMVIENDLTVWYSAWAIFDSSKKTLEQYMAPLHNIVDNYIKPYPERWEHFAGFWYDEKIWRKETNADFITETKHVYQRYGKRTYAVVATGEFTSIEGNDIGVTGDQMKKMSREAFKYITDAGFDSYGIDVRDGALNGDIKNYYKKVSEDIYDGPSYYREYTRIFLELIGKPVNLWYLPCAYTCKITGGLDGITKADEQYCLAHMNFFYEELENQEYAGGLMMYVYGLSKESEDAGRKGLKYHLVVEADDTSEELYKIHPEYPKWKSYSKRLREIVKEYNTTKVNLVK